MKKLRKNPYQIDSQNSIREVNKKEQFIERFWNKDRLLSIVSYGMRIRFQKAEMIYKKSKYTNKYKHIIEMAEMMIRGFDALVKEAKDLGYLKLSPTTWLYEHNKTRYVVVKSDEEYWLAHNAYAEEPETFVLALSELFKMADNELLKTKKIIQETFNQPGRIIEYKKK